MLYCKPAQKPMTEEIAGPREEEPVVIVLLNDPVTRQPS